MLATRFMVDSRQYKAATNLLEGIENGVLVAGMRAVNRAATRGKTSWARAVAADYTVKVKDVRPKIAVHKAIRTRLYAEVVALPTRFELVDFAHKPVTPIHQLKRKPVGGISVNVKRSTGYLTVAGAFKVIGRKSGKERIIWRTREGGKTVGRYPAYILYGPRLDQLALAVLPNIKADIHAYMRKRFSHEVRNVIRRYAKKGKL